MTYFIREGVNFSILRINFIVTEVPKGKSKDDIPLKSKQVSIIISNVRFKGS
jgi:hypothetical protein